MTPASIAGVTLKLECNLAKVVIGKVKWHRSIEIHPLLTESICEAGHSSHRHANGKVLTFDMRRAEAV